MFAKDYSLAQVDSELWDAILRENTRQEEHIELIASENYWFTCRYAGSGFSADQ